VAKGDRVPESINVGDSVVISPYTSCGLCPACRVGRTNCCQFNRTLGLQRDGVLTEICSVHFSKVHRSDRLSYKDLALVEPLSVGYHAANRGRVTEADTVLVIGCGTIGTGAIAAAARKGATIIAADVDADKLEMALKFGAQHTIHSAEHDVLDAVADLTNSEGVAVAIEAVGLPATFRLAVGAAAYAGRVVYIGYAKERVNYDVVQFVRKELDIMGSRNALRTFPAVIKMMEAGQRPFGDLVTKVYPFTATEDALREWDAAPGRFFKILIDVSASG
jgi:threonine dehydrogenase-like Zn-dependent dehydrogenase